MKFAMIIALFMGISVFCSIASADQSFNPPMLRERVIHQCATGPWFSKEGRCKKPAQQFVADHFCKEKGFSYATKFSSNNNPNRTPVSALRIKDGNITWEDKYYFGVFIQITCK